MSQAQAADVDPSPTLGEVIADCRARRRMSRPQLALLVGASLSSVKNWEGDRVTPSPTHLSALEEALGVRFVAGRDGEWRAVDAVPDPAPAPQVVVIVAATAEAMREALDRAGVPRAQ